MTHYRLHYFPESGNSYKLALMLALCGQSFDRVWTDFGKGVTRSAAWRAKVNPMGEIPVLEIDGVKHSQTAPILLRLAQDHHRFGGSDEREHIDILRWLFWDNHKLSSYMATYRFQRAFLTHAEPEVLKFLKSRIDDCLRILDLHLGERDFVVTHEPTIADISLTGYLCFPANESGYHIKRDYPAIGGWLERIAALPGWREPYELLPGDRMDLNNPLN